MEGGSKGCDSTRHKGSVDIYCKHCQTETCEHCAVGRHYRHIESLEHRSTRVLEALNLLTEQKVCMARTRQLLSVTHIQNEVENAARTQEEAIRNQYKQLLASIQEHQFGHHWKLRLCPYVSRLHELHDDAKAKASRVSALLQACRTRLLALTTWKSSRRWDEECSKGIDRLQRLRDLTEAEKCRALSLELLDFARKVARISAVEARYNRPGASLETMCEVDASSLMQDKLILVRKNHHELWVYYPDLCRSKTFTLPATFTSPMNFGMATVPPDLLFLIGGNRTNPSGGTDFLDTVTAISLSRRSVHSQASLKMARRRAGVATIQDRMLFAIGGDSENGCLDSCEAYAVATGRWTDAGRLTESKTNVSVGTFEDRHIYAFGGYSGGSSDLSTVERYDTRKCKKWLRIELSSEANWAATQNMGVMQISPNELLIWGGMRGGQMLKQSVKYLVKQRAFEKCSDMLVSDTFLQVRPQRSGDYVYSFSCHKYDIHVYGMRSGTWSVIPNTEWYNQRDN